MQDYGGLTLTTGISSMVVAAAGTEINGTNTPLLAAITPASRSGGSVSASAATGRLSLTPGTYLVQAEFSLEGDIVSGTSGDGVGVVTLQIHKGGTLEAGSKAKIDAVTADKIVNLATHAIVNIAQSAQDASTATNYVSAYLVATDASGNDLTLREGRITAIRLDT